MFGGSDGIPRSVGKIGEDDVPNMCDGIGEGGASSVPIPKMCDGGTRQKEPVKLGPMAVTGSQSTSSILGVVAIASITLASCMSLTPKMKASAWRRDFMSLIRRRKMDMAVAVSVDSFVDVLGCPEVMLVGATTVDVQWWHLQPATSPRR